MKRALLAAALLLVKGLSAQAVPGPTQIGLRFGTDFDANGKDLPQNILGAVLTRSFNRHWQMAASVSIYPSVNDGAIWASADLRYRPPLVSQFLYFATGVTEADHGAAKNTTGADLAFGLDPRFTGLIRPFAEGKWVIYRWYTSFTVQGGLSVGL
ncbi:MAG TPA: hypothetical protein VNX15_04350 [Gemmatimonadales bacterium]|nr:hypothetical protein [Gemmatimonadales bacterium]